MFKRVLFKVIKRSAIVLFCIYLLPKLTIFYLICGALDVKRNNGLNGDLLGRYFLIKPFTWLLSPINLFFDLISYRNNGVYHFKDLPASHQHEIKELVELADAKKELIIASLGAQLEQKHRGMIFFKWYGQELKTSLDIGLQAKQFEYIKTVGVSVFNINSDTSEHFGPLRATLRVLYNLKPADSDQAYIKVGDIKHCWRDNPLFIFDDTLLHRSVNHTDQLRYCMFIDIVRPSYCYKILNIAVSVSRFIMLRSRKVFYKHWDMLT